MIISGIVNGYNTNNIFCNAINRQDGPNKGKAGYLCVLFLLIGILLATIHSQFYV